MDGRDVKAGRNPRRAYNRDGVELPVATVCSCRAIDHHTINIFCHECGHQIIASLGGMPDDLAIPDIPIAYRLRCSQCGSKRIGVMMDVAAHYDRERVRRGLESALPADRDVRRLAPETRKAPRPKPERLWTAG